MNGGRSMQKPHVESKVWAERILRNWVAPALCGAPGDSWCVPVLLMLQVGQTEADGKGPLVYCVLTAKFQ